MNDRDSSDAPLSRATTYSYPSAKAYRFFRDHRERPFELAELEEATGWKPATVRTYIAKKWQHLLRREGEGLYRVVAFDFSEQEFLALQSQVSPIPVHEPEYDYDVTLSFAGEDRDYVEQVAASLHALGIKVFYDRYEQVDLWGKDLYTHLDDVYRKRARFVSCSFPNTTLRSYGLTMSEKVLRRALSKKNQSTYCQFVLPPKCPECCRPLPTLMLQSENRLKSP